MANLQQPVQKTFFAPALTLVAVGFALLVLYLVSEGHFKGVQQLGLLSAILGFLFTLHGLIEPAANQKLALAFLVLTLFGLMGMYEHREVTATLRAIFQVQSQLSAELGNGQQIQGPPLWAPLCISVLSTFAILSLLLGKRE